MPEVSTFGTADHTNFQVRETHVLAAGWGPYLRRSMKALLFENYLNVLMLCTFPAMWWYYTKGNPGVTFTLALLAIAPFAERLSFVTEQLALHTSETLGVHPHALPPPASNLPAPAPMTPSRVAGGLLNATFGNVTEMIVSLFALNAGLLRIVQVPLAPRDRAGRPRPARPPRNPPAATRSRFWARFSPTCSSFSAAHSSPAVCHSESPGPSTPESRRARPHPPPPARRRSFQAAAVQQDERVRLVRPAHPRLHRR